MSSAPSGGAIGEARRGAIERISAGDDHGALPILDRALLQAAGDPRLLQLKGLALRNVGDLEGALQILEQAARVAPNDRLIAHTLARATLDAGLPAEGRFAEAQRLAPDAMDVVLGHAAALLGQGQIAESEAMLLRESAARPEWVEGHGQLMRLRLMMGASLDDASEGFARALLRKPGNIAIWQGWIDRLLAAGLYKEADQSLAQARFAVRAAPIWSTLDPVIAAELGQTDRADRGFSALGAINQPDLLVRFIRHLFRAGRYPHAASAAERCVTMAGGRMFWPYVALAWRLVRDPRWEWLEGDDRLVSVIDLGDAAGDMDALAAHLRGLHPFKKEPPEQTLRGGTQTDGPLFSRLDPPIRRLRGAVETAVKSHIAQLPPIDPTHPTLHARRDAPVRFAGSWSVRLSDAGHHVDHVHPAGWLSSAFYVTVPDTSGADPHAGWLALGEVRDLVPDLPPFRLIEPRPGRLVLFPSIMWHGTRPFPHGERLTVAFDIAPPPP